MSSAYRDRRGIEIKHQPAGRPLDTEEQLARVVDLYRKRWLIEESFKALKTWCSLERRQARRLRSWLNTAAPRMPQAGDTCA
ncbi:MAG: transposase [Deltaproteobacteria bacterium]|nr:transposase [Deltaproteobacteria bacterium]